MAAIKLRKNEKKALESLSTLKKNNAPTEVINAEMDKFDFDSDVWIDIANTARCPELRTHILKRKGLRLTSENSPYRLISYGSMIVGLILTLRLHGHL